MSDTPQHTPGPWDIDDGDCGPQVIAQVRYADWVVETGRVSADDLCWSPIATFDSDNALADATLAASAPALLSAVDDLKAELADVKKERDALRAVLDSLPDLAHARGLAMDLVDALELGGAS